MNHYPEFAKLLNQYLAAEDRTATWLARRLSVDPATVGRWVNKDQRPGSPENVIRIADILGIYDHKERQALLEAAGYGYVEQRVGGKIELNSSDATPQPEPTDMPAPSATQKFAPHPSERGTATSAAGASPLARRRWRVALSQKGRLLISGVLFLFVLIIKSLFLSPLLAVWHNNEGLKDYLAADLASAQAHYEWALFFNPTYPEAHYNLGLLYEEWREFEHAQQEYQLAAKGDLDAAYNNLARLYICDENYGDAVFWLLGGLERTSDDEVRYDMLKNLGWARLGQERLPEAESHLRAAIQLKADRAPAYCLLAQVWEGQNKIEEALEAWDNCLKYADPRLPDEDAWIKGAKERLKDKGEKSNEEQMGPIFPDFCVGSNGL